MVRNAPPRKRSHFMQIHNASVTLTQSVSDFLPATFRQVILPWYAAKVFFVLPVSAWKWEANLQRIHHAVPKVWNFRHAQFVG